MAVAEDAVGPSVSGQTSVTSPVSWTHTAVASGVAMLVGFGYGHASGADGTLAVTCDGTAMPLLGKIPNNNSTAGLTALYGIANQASGAHAMVVTVTGGAASPTLECGSVSYSGASLSSPFGAAVTAFGDSSVSGTMTVTVTGTTSGNMVSAVGSIGTGVLTNPVTSRWLANFSNSNAAGNAGQSDKAAGGSVTFTWTDSSAGDFWGAVGVEILASAPVSAPSYWMSTM